MAKQIKKRLFAVLLVWCTLFSASIISGGKTAWSAWDGGQEAVEAEQSRQNGKSQLSTGERLQNDAAVPVCGMKRADGVFGTLSSRQAQREGRLAFHSFLAVLFKTAVLSCLAAVWNLSRRRRKPSLQTTIIMFIHKKDGKKEREAFLPV